jgi:glycosyltransferase involved in cell wall biosynthesis
MAAGLAVASPAVGDIAEMVAEENRAFITPAGDEAALAESLWQLAENPGLREAIGRANRERAQAEYDERAMISAYRAVYAQAMRRADFP